MKRRILLISLLFSPFIFSSCVPIPMPFYDYGFPTYRQIVPECEGWITDKNGKGIENAKMTMISYGKSSSVCTDRNGHFVTGNLYKLLSFIRKPHGTIYDTIPQNVTTIGGDVSNVFGELALFVETRNESFILIGQNTLPLDHAGVPEPYTPYEKRKGFIYCREVDKECKRSNPVSIHDQYILFQLFSGKYYPRTPFFATLNPLDGKTYLGEKQFLLTAKNIQKYVITTKYSQLRISSEFLSWMLKNSSPHGRGFYFKEH